jgi:hypothetical protein
VDLETLGFQWGENLSAGIVTITVGIEVTGVQNAKALVESAGEIIDGEVNNSMVLPAR